jgi:putative transposase
MMPEMAVEFPQASKVQLCRLLGVSRSEAYRKEPPSKDPLLEAIEKLVTTFLGYGYRRVHRALLKQGIQASEHAVRKTMRENGLRIRKPKPRGITKSDPKARKHDNLLKLYEPTKSNEIWVTDMTLVRTGTGPCYLAAIVDLFSRKVVSWHLSRSPNLKLALTCLEKGLERRRPDAGWIHHSDQGSVYTAPAYVARVRASGGRMSMSKAATPTDNAHMESFFATLKKEEVKGNRYDSFLELEASLETYIQGNYNAQRMHTALGYLSPDQYEAQSREVGQ